MEIFILFAVGVGIWLWMSRPRTQRTPAEKEIIGAVSPPINREQMHLSKALSFVNQHVFELKQAQVERITWQRQYAHTTLSHLDQMDGLQFEHYLAGLLRERGYSAEVTRGSGDFGADIILTEGSKRIAVQAKRWREAVGIGAVQEVIAAKEYYQCQATWVIATARYTPQARELAKKANVMLIDRNTLAVWIAERPTSNNSDRAA